MIDSVRNAPLLLDRSRWAGRRNFTVLHTQFDAGRRFIDTWSAWRDDPQRCERLHFVAVAALDSMTTPPVMADQPALSKLLADAWPMPVAGVHRLEFDDGHVVLTLAAGDAQSMLQKLWMRADSFYLHSAAFGENAAVCCEGFGAHCRRQRHPLRGCSSRIAQSFERRGFHNR